MTKKKLTLLTNLFLLFVCLMVVSCKSDDDDAKPGIIGTWVSQKIQYTVYRNDDVEFDEETETDELVFRFDKNKTGEFVSEKVSFKYELTDSDLTLTFTDGNDTEEDQVFTIKEITSDNMVLMIKETSQTDEDTIQEISLITFRRSK